MLGNKYSDCWDNWRHWGCDLSDCWENWRHWGCELKIIGKTGDTGDVSCKIVWNIMKPYAEV